MNETIGYVPISRDLLTTVITNDYPVGNILYTQGGNENVPNTFKTIKNYERKSK